MRRGLALRYEQVKRLAPAISLAIQSATLSGVLYSLVAWRGLGPWVVPVCFALILGLAATAAWFYYEVLGMKEAEREAWLSMDHYQTRHFTPKEARVVELVALALKGNQEAKEILLESARRGKL